jgi:hypothetical protein
VFLDSTHAPYHMPEGYPPVATPMAADIDFLKFGPEHDPTPELNRYRTAVHYADSLIGSLLDDLRAQGLAEDTIVLVTGDHAEEFNDLKLNYWGHNGNFSDYQLQVPFVLHWPGKASGHDARTSSHEDWVPTLMRHAWAARTHWPTTAPARICWPNRRAACAGGRKLVAARGAPWRCHLCVRQVRQRHRPGPALPPAAAAGPDAAAVRTAWEALTRFRNR